MAQWRCGAVSESRSVSHTVRSVRLSLPFGMTCAAMDCVVDNSIMLTTWIAAGLSHPTTRPTVHIPLFSLGAVAVAIPGNAAPRLLRIASGFALPFFCHASKWATSSASSFADSQLQEDISTPASCVPTVPPALATVLVVHKRRTGSFRVTMQHGLTDSVPLQDALANHFHRKLTILDVRRMNDFTLDWWPTHESGSASVKLPNFENMSADDLWALHAEVSALLTAKISAEKLELERRLARLKGRVAVQGDSATAKRRPYPKVFPKYQNPVDTTETWSGRGKQPKWISAQLKSGKTLDDFAITDRKDL
jgi:DNA-binding protein H-NS